MGCLQMEQIGVPYGTPWEGLYANFSNLLRDCKIFVPVLSAYAFRDLLIVLTIEEKSNCSELGLWRPR